MLRFSYSLEKNKVVMPGPIDPPRVIPRSRMVEEPKDVGPEQVRWGSYNNTSFAYMFIHSGTHIDVNFHIDPSGFKLAAFEIDDFISERPALLEISKGDMGRILVEDLKPYEATLKQSDFLFVYTGYSKHRETDPDRYLKKQPSFSVDAARYLMENFSLKGVGVDLMGIENIGEAKGLDPQFPVHKAFLKAGRKFYLVEDANLAPLRGKKLLRSYAIPLLLPDAEGMMITGFVDVEEVPA
jgi:kynurenine formamidase